MEDRHGVKRLTVCAYGVSGRASDGPIEAVIGRLEHLRGSAPGFRNLTNYVIR